MAGIVDDFSPELKPAGGCSGVIASVRPIFA
jgi:hypothetical protein